MQRSCKSSRLQQGAGTAMGAETPPSRCSHFTCPQDLVTATKGQITAHLRESEEQNRCTREKKERLLRQLQELRNEMNQARAKAHGSLAGLTVQSSATLKTLARVVEKVRPAACRQGKHRGGGRHPLPLCPHSQPPPRASASCGWLRCAAGLRQKRRRCCPSTLPRWQRGSSKMPSESSRRCLWSPWPR